eukprot:TRINITY_DN23913_c0_g1_i1.p1 TRINITY_DN23913_c0_g1~~TRINITY_DN23913_c0_g1_i1.p1  ORF type:complete len:480 (-),score=107.23 TRINITY_DN23913_c0_g1_i1:103-1500(-)
MTIAPVPSPVSRLQLGFAKLWKTAPASDRLQADREADFLLRLEEGLLSSRSDPSNTDSAATPQAPAIARMASVFGGCEEASSSTHQDHGDDSCRRSSCCTCIEVVISNLEEHEPSPQTSPVQLLDRLQPSMPRKVLISALFKALLAPQAVRLKHQDLRRFANFCGFEGDMKAWTKEYLELCSDYCWSASDGIDMKQFSSFVNDRRGNGFCSNAELCAFAAELGRGEAHEDEEKEEEKTEEACESRAADDKPVDPQDQGHFSDEVSTADGESKAPESEADPNSDVDRGIDRLSNSRHQSDADESSDCCSDSESDCSDDCDSDSEYSYEEDSDIDEEEAQEVEEEDWLEHAPALGTLVEVCFEDDTYGRAIVIKSCGRKSTVAWVTDDNELEEPRDDSVLDFSSDCVRLRVDQAGAQELYEQASEQQQQQHATDGDQNTSTAPYETAPDEPVASAEEMPGVAAADAE